MLKCQWLAMLLNRGGVFVLKKIAFLNGNLLWSMFKTVLDKLMQIQYISCNMSDLRKDQVFLYCKFGDIDL